jgi:arylsulfatase A-like enzyme
MRPSSAWRSGRWKLVHWHESHDLQLFDLQADPGETTDLAAEMPEQALLLYQQLDAWRERVGAQLPRPNPQFEKGK